VNVQHRFVAAFVQSDFTWHSWTVDESLHAPAKCVGHADAALHVVPIDVIPQVGNVPVPSSTSLPQHTGVSPPQPSGPSHVIWSALAQLAVATQPKVVVAAGIAQHTLSVVHAALPAQPNGYTVASPPPSLPELLPPHAAAATTTTTIIQRGITPRDRIKLVV
jgi:hypothetical protein